MVEIFSAKQPDEPHAGFDSEVYQASCCPPASVRHHGSRDRIRLSLHRQVMYSHSALSTISLTLVDRIIF